MTKRIRNRRTWIDWGGDEISRVGYWFSPHLDASTAAERLELDENFWDEMERVAIWCDATLQRQGFPDAAAQVRANIDGVWCYVVDDDEPIDEARADALKIWQGFGGLYAGMHSAPLSDEWFAGDLGIKIWQLEVARHSLNDLHLGLILQIGFAMKDLEWRRKFSPEILSFRQIRSRRHKGSGVGGAVLADRAQEARAKIAELAFASGDLVRWAGKSLKAQARDLRTMAIKYDKGRSDEEKLFRSPKKDILSSRWFEDRISEWQSEDLISTALTKLLKQ